MKINRLAHLLAISATVWNLGGTKALPQSGSSPKEPRHKQLGKAYGFLLGQEFSLNRVKAEYPQLKTAATLAELEFASSPFGSAKQGIRLEFETLLKQRSPEAQWADFETKLRDQIIENLQGQVVSSTQAQAFIETVIGRAGGNITDDIRSILLSASPEYRRNPAREVTEGLTTKFLSTGNPKAKGSKFSLSIPYSWRATEGDRPNVVQVFQSGAGYGDVVCTVLVKQFPEQLMPTEEEIRSFFTEEGLSELAPEGSRVLRAVSVTLDGLPSGLLVTDLEAQRVDFRIKTRTFSFVTIYKSHLIQFQFMLASTSDPQRSLDDLETENIALIKAIAGTFVALDKY